MFSAHPPPPRLAILSDDQLPEETRAIIHDWPYNLHRILANSPATLPKWMTFAQHILRDNTLPAWDREIAILRVAWNCRSDYEWGMHERLARSIGFTDAHLRALAAGADAAIWKPHEAALVSAVDQMQRDWGIDDAAWAVLQQTYTPAQLVDLVMVVGQFILVALSLNVFRIPLEPHINGLPSQGTPS